VQAEIELDDLDDDDLIDELERRGYLVSDKEDGKVSCVNHAINVLKDNGVPQEIIDQLSEWAREPIANMMALESWVHARGKA
jgi:hypothetical protein